jgi:hypothetical protein
MMLAGLSTWHAGAAQIVVLGSADETLPLRAEIARQYLPFALLIPVAPGAGQQAMAAALPFVATMEQIGGRATAFVCRDFACGAPVNTPDALAAQLLPA